MAIKSTNVVFAFAPQVDKDTPNPGPYTSVSRRSGGFSSSGEDADSDTVGASGMKDAATLGQITHSGSFEFDFVPDNYDALLESAMRGRWTADELTLGKDPLYLTWVVFNPGLAAARQYTRYSGCLVNSATFNFPKDGAGLVGLSVELGVANRTFLGVAPTINDPADATKMRTCDVLSVQVDDIEVPSVIDSLDLSIASDNESVFDIRQCDPVEIVPGSATFGGTLALLHDNDSDQYYRDAASGQEFKLEIILDTATTDYRIEIPRTVNRSTGPDYTNDNATVSVPYGATGTPPTIYRTIV